MIHVILSSIVLWLGFGACPATPAQDPQGGVVQARFFGHGPVHWAFPDLEFVRLVGPDGLVFVPAVDEEYHFRVNFTVPGPGPYTFVLEDPRFESKRVEGLASGGPLATVDLIGLSALRIEAFDAVTGLALEGWKASLRLANSSYPSSNQPWDVATLWSRPEYQGQHGRANVFELTGDEAIRDAEGWFRAIAPADYTLIVEAPGFAASYLACPGLAAGEERRFEVPMWRPGSVTGHVKGSLPFTEKGFPVEVFAFAPGEEAAPAAGITFAQGVEVMLGYRGFGLARSTSALDEEGIFRLEGLAPGVYMIQARQKGMRREPSESKNHFEDVLSACTAVIVSPDEASEVVVRWREE